MPDKAKSKEALDEKELSALLAQGYPPASATFINDLPVSMQINIVQIGCKFVYDDGYNDNEGRNVNIPGGGQSDTLTASYTGCCRAYFVVMKAKAFDGSGQEWNLVNSTTVPAGYCGSNLRWHLVPATSFKQGDTVNARGLMLRLEAQP